MSPIQAIVFDLYGTLLTVRSQGVHRELPRVMGVSPRDWVRLVRNELLTSRFDDLPSFAKFICDRMTPDHGEEVERACIGVIEAERESIHPIPGALTLLHFLKRRGFRLGLVSNLSSSYKEPVDRFELTPLFDEIFFSCDEGITKPDPEVYRLVCDRLGTSLKETLYIGDSWHNDVVAPRELGAEAIHVSSDREGGVASVAEIGLLNWEGSDRSPLAGPGESFSIDGEEVRIQQLEAVADDEQGRYNFVYRCNSNSGTWYLKRYGLPESAWVEDFAYRVYREIGLPSCNSTVLRRTEPLLAVAEAPGVKWDEQLTPEISWEIGRHFTFAYVFSNADIRPRNAFFSEHDGTPRITMIDLEHCFFDLAIDTSGIDDPFDPHQIDAVADVRGRTAKRVLTDRAMRRARRSFVVEEQVGEQNMRAYKQGFTDFFNELKKQRSSISMMFRERVHESPYLIIGTRGYRRAMAHVDVEDMLSRIDDDPASVLARFC